MKQYDYIIVGAGLYGSVFAHEAARQGKRCLVVEKRDHIGCNCYTHRMNDISSLWTLPKRLFLLFLKF